MPGHWAQLSIAFLKEKECHSVGNPENSLGPLPDQQRHLALVLSLIQVSGF